MIMKLYTFRKTNYLIMKSSFFSSVLHRPVCVGPCRKSRRPVFSRHGHSHLLFQFQDESPTVSHVAIFIGAACTKDYVSM